jgi:SulP family sulfate permease
MTEVKSRYQVGSDRVSTDAGQGRPGSAERRSLIKRAFPFLRWLPLPFGALRADLLAGLTVGLLLIPQSMAYAQLAGLPPQYGLYTAFVPVIVGGLFGWCAQLHTGPVAMVSLVTASVIANLGLAAPGTPEYVALAVLLALLAGLLLLLLGVLRLAAVVNFVSHPVIVGFTNASALIIAASQLPQLIGVPSKASSAFVLDLCRLAVRLGDAHLPTVALGAGTVGAILLLRWWRPRWPGVLLTMAAVIVASRLMDYGGALGGQVVGRLPSGLPRPMLPVLHWEALPGLLPGAVVIAFVGFMEVLAICKVISSKTRERLDMNQELIGQGLAGIAGSLTQCYPVSGSFSRSALNLYAGARTGFSSLFAGLLVMVTLLFLTPLLAPLPRAALGAVIVVAVAGLIDFRAIGRIARANRQDGVVAIVTFVATLAFAPHITHGILVGVVLAIGILLFQMMRPTVATLQQRPDGTLATVTGDGTATGGRTLVFRFDGRLIFLNTSYFEETILAALAEQPQSRNVLIVADGINDLDASGEEILRSTVETFHGNGIEVAFCGVKEAVMNVMVRSGLKVVIGERRFYATVESALADLEASRRSGDTQILNDNQSGIKGGKP